MMRAPVSETFGSPVALAVIRRPHLRGESLGRPLSKRQWEALAACARTDYREQAAAVMGISRHTLTNHLTQIHAKLGTLSAIGAFRAVGWLQVPKDIAA